MHEQDILKYLDNELPEKEKKAFEEQLHRKPELKHKLEAVLEKRREALEAIDTLNPPEPVEIPDFSAMQSTDKRRNLFMRQWWRIAAAVLILVAAAIIFFNRTDQTTEKTMTAENAPFQNTEEVAVCSELDYYISPNRCWNRRELIDPPTPIKKQ